MKRSFLLFVAGVFALLSTNVNAQNLTIKGTDADFTKGNIDVEVLSEIIQQKQDELKKKVFKDLVIDNFKKNDYLNNFATFYYMYNTMETLTAEKNKTVLARKIMQESANYALIYSFAIAINKHLDDKTWNSMSSTSTTLDLGNFDFVPDLSPEDNKSYINIHKKLKEDTNKVKLKKFNYMLDLAFDVIKNNKKAQEKKLLKFSEDDEFTFWYNADNLYLKQLDTASDGHRTKLMAQHAAADKFLTDILTHLGENSAYQELYKIIRATMQNKGQLNEITFKQYKEILNCLHSLTRTSFYLTENAFVSKITKFITDYSMVVKEGSDSSIVVDGEALISVIFEKFASDKKTSSTSSWAFFINPRPYFSMGINNGIFLSNNTLGNDNSNLKNIQFASEKIGLKVKLFDFRYSHAFGPGETFKYKGTYRTWYRPVKEFTINDIYYYVSTSGLLYNLANIKTESSFNYVLLNAGFGMSFYNDLALNIGLSAPIVNGDISNNNLFINVGFDVPILSYLGALKK
ncbi:hypothetical protein GC194_00460 [bacterium]|nr:hypothetical protein [bacterium]